MAKVKVLFGQMRGKVGGMVFRHDADGFTVASEYNPKPANPRSAAQTEQRNKMNLAGQISKLTPYIAIAGMGGTKRTARSKFVSAIIRHTTVTPTDNGGNSASINHDQLVLSEGAPVTLNTEVTYSQELGGLTVSVANAEEGREVLFCRVIVYLVKGTQYITSMCKDTQTMSGTTAQTVDFDLSNIYQSGAGMAVVYVVPVLGENAQARVIYGQYVTIGIERNEYKVAAARQLAALGAFGRSVLGGTAAITQA